MFPIYVVFIVEACTALGNEGGVDNGYIAHLQRCVVPGVDIVDRGIDTSLLHDFVSHTRIMAPEGFATVLEIDDVIAMPYYAHGIYLAEFYRNTANVCNFHGQGIIS